MKFTDILMAVLILAIVLIIIVPLSTGMMDMLLIVNIALSILILLIALNVKETLEFSTFPTMLLIVTLFRLALNISSTRLILGNGGNAGKVIETFGGFVMGSNLVVGFVIFLIIVIIQFIVITKGAERVAEVAARFTLDAMPGKQMAIDADLNTGVISEAEAQHRRSVIQREADFYGAMDGASKFIKGDAIVGIIITVINIVGGIIIGALGIGASAPMPLEKVVTVYALAAVGDGLVSQLPALLVSTSAGIIVTRSATNNSFGSDLSEQLFAKPHVVILMGGMLAMLAFIPGLPTLPLLFLAAGLPLAAYFSMGAQ
ncbi:MAG TPA: FHIPEP family type III secretion protein, partial [Clostridia bacterium]|nr:FHIPEP family type III secretion protein [Clostridia bacterium]